MKNSYKEKRENYYNFLESQGYIVDPLSELKFEALTDNYSLHTTQEILDWYLSYKESPEMSVEQIPLSECREWSIDPTSGSIRHSSGEFYSVEGFRVTGSASREVKNGWDQPLLTQTGFDGGILGLIRQRKNHVPHYLVEAKEEPGNYNIVQISPTLQATFSNLKKAHLGRRPSYSDIFLTPEDHPVKVLFDQWTSEDGGRLFNKRNRSMLIEYDEHINLDCISDRFRWMTLFQIKKLIRDENAIIAPHIRGIISGF